MKKFKTERLERYERIAQGLELPRYINTKNKRIKFESFESIEQLWKLHGERNSGNHSSEFTQERKTLLDLKIEISERIDKECILCERRCRVNRTKGEKGICGVLGSRISSDFIHMGEEPEIIPSYTIFFSGCTFKCVFCQNWDISTQPESGSIVSPERLAVMIENRDASMGFDADRLREVEIPAFFRRPKYAKNVNWVGGEPTSNIPFILKTLKSCRSRLPQVWNSNMYLTEESMELLDGVIDLYLTDFKYGNDRCAKRLSGIDNYFEIISRNHAIAACQCDVLVRQLVLPNHIECCTRPILQWISKNIPEAAVNVMSQYRPEHMAQQFDDISRSISSKEHGAALKIAMDLGLRLTS